MRRRLRIGIVADYDPKNKYHLATEQSVTHAAEALGLADSAQRKRATQKLRERTMSDAAVQRKPAGEAEREMTDGFHLVIDALKLNGINTIYGVPGIPITDFGRMAQAAGIRVANSPAAIGDTVVAALGAAVGKA